MKRTVCSRKDINYISKLRPLKLWKIPRLTILSTSRARQPSSAFASLLPPAEELASGLILLALHHGLVYESIPLAPHCESVCASIFLGRLSRFGSTSISRGRCRRLVSWCASPRLDRNGPNSSDRTCWRRRRNKRDERCLDTVKQTRDNLRESDVPGCQNWELVDVPWCLAHSGNLPPLQKQGARRTSPFFNHCAPPIPPRDIPTTNGFESVRQEFGGVRHRGP